MNDENGGEFRILNLFDKSIEFEVQYYLYSQLCLDTNHMHLQSLLRFFS